MTHRIIGYENGTIDCCKIDDCKSCDKQGCNKCCRAHFEEIKEICCKKEIDGITIDYENTKLKCLGYCGYFQLSDGTEVYILPKINTENFLEGEQIFKNLVENAYSITKIKTGSNTSTELKKNNLFIEILIKLFCKFMETLFKKGVKKFYSVEEDNLPYLKGKIKFSEHIKRNIASREKFYVEYDEFTDNIPENRILKSACSHLLKKINSFEESLNEQKNLLREENKKLLRRYMQEFGDIEESKNLENDFSKLQPNRLYQHYEKPLQFAEVFLYRKNYWIKRGKRKFPAILFSLDSLFEDFIQRLLNEFVKGKFWVQYSGNYLLKDYSKEKIRNLFGTRMDFVVHDKSETRFLIIDAKYKLIDLEKWIKSVEGMVDIQATERDTNISQNDLYQVFTYSEIIKTSFKKNNPKVDIVLLYPKNDKFKAEKLKDCVYFHYFNNTKISFIPIDLIGEDEEIIIENNSILREFIEKFFKESTVSESDTGK